LKGFNELSSALGDGGRKLPLLPPVQRGVYTVENKVTAPRTTVGADVLPWWPAVGVYVLIEAGQPPLTGLQEVDGVVGIWSATSRSVDSRLASARAGQSITYCFLDDDPVDVARRLRPVLTSRWTDSGVEPLLAAPFHPVVPHQWDRHVP
jgi:hypothetical protein